MPTFPGQDGTSVYIKGSTVYRFKSIDYSNPAEGTKIDYSGSYLLTPWTTEKVLEALDNPANIVELTTRANSSVYINSNAVTMVRPAIPSNGPGTELTVGGRYQHVVEDFDTVMELLGKS